MKGRVSDVTGNTDSVEVRGIEGASGIVVADGDVSHAECTGVACAVSVPRAGAGKLDSWVRCSAGDEVASETGLSSDIDEVPIDSDSWPVVG
jgi:hypothetical protein